MKKNISIVITVIVCGFLGALTFALWPTDSRILVTDTNNLSDAELIKQGQYLAVLGDCMACHTQLRGSEYAGGAAIESPIGKMYPPNITPDRRNGIGGYTLNDFDRAMRYGIRQDGVTLYPSMPYPSFARLSDEDIKALYAYFMHDVKPAAIPNRANGIPWPLSIRWPVAIWRKIYAPKVVAFDHQQYQNTQIARGAYLVEGLGHCGSCHTPRALTLQEKGLDGKTTTYLTGDQVIDGWFAPSLRDESAGLKYWTAEDIVVALRDGRTATHSIIGKPMNDVVIHSSSLWRDEDRQAVAAYLKALPSIASASENHSMAAGSLAIASSSDIAFLYYQSCSSCHGLNGEGKPQLFPTLKENNTVLADNPESLIRLVLEGYDMPVVDHSLLPMRMPHFYDSLTDQQIAEVITYIRNNWGNQASPVMEGQVKQVRKTMLIPVGDKP